MSESKAHSPPPKWTALALSVKPHTVGLNRKVGTRVTLCLLTLRDLVLFFNTYFFYPRWNYMRACRSGSRGAALQPADRDRAAARDGRFHTAKNSHPVKPVRPEPCERYRREMVTHGNGQSTENPSAPFGGSSLTLLQASLQHTERSI